jgi:hypothetical protein
MASNEKNFKVKLGVTTPKVDYTLDDKVITAEMLDLATPTLSYSGSAGQLFSISDDLTGTIFSVNDISGIPSLEVNADGTVSIAEFDGNVGVGTSSPTQKLDVAGAIRTNDGIYSSTDLILGSNDTAVAYVKTSGEVGIGVDIPTNTLDVNGTFRARTVNNATGDFATVSATGVLQKRTAAETLSDIGASASSHTHGNITNAGAIGTTSDQVVTTTTSGVLTTSSRSGIDSRSTFPPSSHTHPVSEVSDSTTLGQNLVKFANPGAIRFIRINADNSVSALDAATFRGAIGAGTSSTTGTVTSVAAGDGLDFTTITGSGSVTLGTPGSLTGATTNAVTATSHTHSVSLTASDVGAVAANTAITGATHPKITYDSKGLVTAGAALVAGDIPALAYLSNSTSSTQAGYFGDIYLYDDSTPSHYLQITNSANLTAARTLSINVNDAARTVSLSGNLTVSAAATVSGTNTGDQTITLTGDVTGSGTGSFATTLATVTVGKGGTGLTSVTSNSYLKGAGTGNLVQRTYAEVKTDLSLNNVENTAISTYTGFDSRYYTETEVDNFAVKLTGNQTISGVKTFRNANAIRVEAAATQDAVIVAGRAGGTSSYAVTFVPTTLTASRTLTLPNESGTLARIEDIPSSSGFDTAGNGLTSSGTTVSMGTPSTLTASTLNATTSTSHTHEITGFLPLTGGTLTDLLTVSSGGASILNGGGGLRFSGTTNRSFISPRNSADTDFDWTRELSYDATAQKWTVEGPMDVTGMLTAGGADTGVTWANLVVQGTDINSGLGFPGATGGSFRIGVVGSDGFVGARGGDTAKGLKIDTSGKVVAQKGLDVTGNLDVTGTGEFTSSLRGSTIGTSNTSSSSGQGVSLYGGPYTGFAPYSIMFAGPATYGTHGGVTGDWATYFVINSSSTRGWIWKAGTGTSGNVFSVSGNGRVTVTGTLIIPSK